MTETAPGGAQLLLAERLFDGSAEACTRGAAVLIQDGQITAAGQRQRLGGPADAEVTELGDVTLMPGLIDAHMHFFGVDTLALDELVHKPDAEKALFASRDARRLLDAGFTTVRDLGSAVAPALSKAVDEGLVAGPRIIHAGNLICPTNGTWDHLHMSLADMARLDMIVDGVEEVRTVVRRRLRLGAGVIKLGLSRGPWSDRFRGWGDDPRRQVTGFTLDEVRAAVDEAHRYGVPVAVHAIGDEAVNQALDAEVDTIEHAHGIGPATRERLVRAGTPVGTTLAHMALLAESGPLGNPEAFVAAARRHREVQATDLRLCHEAGVPLAGGTDLIGPPWAPHGDNAIELELMVERGIDAASALRAMTSGAATALGLGAEVGSVAAGHRADVIAVEGDPLTDVTACRRVVLTVKAGVMIRPSA